MLENRPGAGGITGVAAAARATPDGYTMLVHSSSFSASYSLHKQLPYDTFKDFAAVIPLGFQPTVLVVAASKPWKTLGELVAEAKAKPGALNFASAGVGAASHLAAERFRLARRLRGAAHPVQGPGRGADRSDGRSHRLLLPAGRAGAEPDPRRQDPRAGGEHVETRAARCRTCPTTAEAGLKDAAYVFWNGLFFPAKTPADIVTRLHAETTKALAVASVQERLAKIGQEPLRDDAGGIREVLPRRRARHRQADGRRRPQAELMACQPPTKKSGEESAARGRPRATRPWPTTQFSPISRTNWRLPTG